MMVSKAANDDDTRRRCGVGIQRNCRAVSPLGTSASKQPLVPPPVCVPLLATTPMQLSAMWFYFSPALQPVSVLSFYICCCLGADPADHRAAISFDTPVERLYHYAGPGNDQLEQAVTDGLVIDRATLLPGFPHLVARDYRTPVGTGDLVLSNMAGDGDQLVSDPSRQLLVVEVKHLTEASGRTYRTLRGSHRRKAAWQAHKYAEWWRQQRPMWQVTAATYNNLDGLRYV